MKEGSGMSGGEGVDMRLAWDIRAVYSVVKQAGASV
jgi:hypothetical protein